jgi:hypothetical protein
MRHCLLFLLLASGAAQAGIFDMDGEPIDEFTFAIEGRVWLSSLSGEIEADSDAIPGTDIDFEKELDLESDEFAFEGEAVLRLKKVLIRGRYVQTRFEDSETLSRSIAFDGTTFTVSERVDAEVTFRVGGPDVEFLLVDVGSAADFGFELGVGVGVRYLYAGGEIRSEVTGIRERDDHDTWVPVVSVSAGLGISNVVRLDAHVSGFKLRIGSITSTLLDGVIEAKVFFLRYVWAGVGWRQIFAEIEVDRGDDFDVEVSLSGPFVSVGVQF